MKSFIIKIFNKNNEILMLFLFALILGPIFCAKFNYLGFDVSFFGQLQSKAEVLDKYNPLTYHLLKYFSFFVDLGNFLNQLNIERENNFLIMYIIQSFVFYFSISLITFSLTKNFFISLISPLIAIQTNFYIFSDSYPIQSSAMGYIAYTSFFIVILIPAFLNEKKTKTAFFIAGIFPYFHLVFGVYVWAFIFLYALIKKEFSIYFFYGAFIFIGLYIYHITKNNFQLNSSDDLNSYFFYFYINFHDYHRQPINYQSVNFFISCITITLLFSIGEFRKNILVNITPIAIFLIFMFITYISYAAIHFIDITKLPKVFFQFMPSRNSNFLIVFFMPLVFLILEKFLQSKKNIFYIILVLLILTPEISKYPKEEVTLFYFIFIIFYYSFYKFLSKI